AVGSPVGVAPCEVGSTHRAPSSPAIAPTSSPTSTSSTTTPAGTPLRRRAARGRASGSVGPVCPVCCDGGPSGGGVPPRAGAVCGYPAAGTSPSPPGVEPGSSAAPDGG